MRIAQVAPLIESVPPGGYGGTEAVVSYLTEELVRQGHDVTLFASGDSQTSAELVAVRTSRAAARRGHHRSAGAPGGRAGGGGGAGPPLRRDSLAPRLLPLPAVATARRATRHDAPRPARHRGPPAGLHRVQRHAGRLDLERPAVPAAAGQLGRDDPPRPAARRAGAAFRGRRIPRVPGAHLAGEARRSRHRDRASHRARPSHRGQGG